MATPNRSGFLVSLLLITTGVLLLPFISSCGKGANANPTGLNTQLQIINLSPDIQPVNLYLNFIKENLTTYTYPNNSGYFFISTLRPPLELRTATNAPQPLVRIDSVLKPNSKYTLFITGFRRDSSIRKSILSLDLKANGTGTQRWTAIPFNTISPYVQLPVGNYNFTINVNTTPNKTETQLQNITIQDGRAYTIYTQGIVGRTDSVAFGAAILNNNLLLKTRQ